MEVEMTAMETLVLPILESLLVQYLFYQSYFGMKFILNTWDYLLEDWIEIESLQFVYNQQTSSQYSFDLFTMFLDDYQNVENKMTVELVD